MPWPTTTGCCSTRAALHPAAGAAPHRLSTDTAALLPRRLLAEMLTPAEATAAARANPGTATEIRFR
jgi:hypothetical protein